MTISIRYGNESDFSRLSWAWGKDISTQKVFKRRISKGMQELWVVESHKNTEVLLGEFHIVWKSPDLDEADGQLRAYLCAFRIHPEYRGQGLGRRLFESVLKRVKKAGKTEVTIGVKKNRPEIKQLYHSWGFTKLIKEKHIDHHSFDDNELPNYVESPIELYLKSLNH